MTTAASSLSPKNLSSRTPRPARSRRLLASMGIYAFDTKALIEVLAEDSQRADSSHDFGGG